MNMVTRSTACLVVLMLAACRTQYDEGADTSSGIPQGGGPTGTERDHAKPDKPPSKTATTPFAAFDCAALPALPGEEVIYVATNGSDDHTCADAANPNAPKATIGAALDCISFDAGAGANKTVEVFGGTYEESLLRGNSFPKGSSWSAPFTLRARLGETVVVKPSSGGYSMTLNDEDSGVPFYAVIQGITFDGTHTTGGNVVSFASYVRLACNELINNDYGNALIGGREHVELVGNRIHGGKFGCLGDCVGGGGSYGYPLYWGSDGALFDGNELYDFPTFGFHIYRYTGCPSGITVRNNIVRDFGWAAGCPDNGDPRCAGRGPDDRGVGILACGTNHDIHDNIVYNGPTGINAYTGSGKHVYKNTVYNMSMGGILADDSNSNVVEDNIVYNPAMPAYGDIHVWYTPDMTTYDRNLCARSGNGCTLVGDPLFVDAANGNFKLQEGSPATGLGATF